MIERIPIERMRFYGMMLFLALSLTSMAAGLGLWIVAVLTHALGAIAVGSALVGFGLVGFLYAYIWFTFE